MESCLLCLNSIENKHSYTIKADTIEILGVIFENSNLQLTQGCAICQDCSEKINAAFDFKCVCINTEDFLAPFELLKGTSRINLKRLTLTVNGKEEVIEIPQCYEVCRLCLDLVNKNFISLLNETHKNMLRIFIPKLIVENTLNPVACEACFISLDQHTTFINNCLQLQEKTKNDRVNETNEFKLQTVEIYENQENLEEEGKTNIDVPELSNATLIDKENNRPQVIVISKKRPKDEECKKNLRSIICKIDLHLINLEDINSKKKIETKGNETKKCVLKQLDLNKLNTCNSKTTKRDISTSNKLNKFYLENKLLEYKCNKCEFQTAFECALKLHKLNHEENASKMLKSTCGSFDVQLHKCKLCPYETKNRIYLEFHKVRHNNLKRMPVHKHESQTKTKHNITSDESKRKDKEPKCKSTGIRNYKRIVCSYKIGNENSLKSHKSKYKDHSEIPMHKFMCGYETKHKGSLESHISKHKSVLDKQTYKSSKKERNNKTTLKSCESKPRKQLSEIQMYKCRFCDYEAKHKESLELHMSKHKSTFRGTNVQIQKEGISQKTGYG